MHHLRIDLSGPQDVRSRLAGELLTEGAQRVAQPGRDQLVWSADDGSARLEALSRRHPRVKLGIESFEAYEDEVVRLLLEGGRATVMDRRPVLPEGFGRYHEDGGEPLDRDRLRAAAESLDQTPMARRPLPLASALETMLTVGEAIGRLCMVSREVFADDAPRPGELQALSELGCVALTASAGASSSTQAELEFEHALRLTRCVAHAARDELHERPGKADWPNWLGILLGAAGEVLDAALLCRDVPSTDLHLLAFEHHTTPEEQLESAGSSLLTACLQALVLFGDRLER